MPALPNVNRVIRVQLLMNVGSDLASQNRFYVQYSGTPPTVANLNTWLTTMVTHWTTRIAPLCTPTVVLVGIEATDLTSTSSAQGFVSASVPGTRAGQGLPAATAVVISQHIARRYRGGKPRVYLPAGAGPDLLTLQTWTAAFISAVAAGWTNFMADIQGDFVPAGAGPTIVNVSFFQGFTNKTFPSGRTRPVPTPRATPVIDAVTSFTVNGKMASQRRRNKQSA